MVNSTASQLPTDVQFEKQLGQLSTFVRIMRQAGLPIEEAIQKPIDDPEMRKRLVRFWNSGGFEATTSQKLAREIMGKNYFGIEEAIQHFGVKPTKAQLSALAEISLTEAELRECKDTHILVAVFPMSILEIRSKVPSDQRLFYDQDWYNKESFAKSKGETSWQLVRKTPVENSTNKTWSDQQALLGKNEETPTAQIMVYTIIGHFLSVGERLFENVYVRCSDLDSDGHRVYVGYFDSEGLCVNIFSDGNCHDFLGLASARKFD
jgi:hypothetical protein